MVSLLLTVLALQVAIHLINKFGATTINELLWIVYNKLPTPTSAAVADGTRLKGEVLRMKREMNAVSAQDDFARWAKLRRQHDKVVAEHERNMASLNTAKTQFDTIAKTARWLSTNGLRFFLQFWFSKRPMFWVPSGWVPAYVEWLLAFPRAPTGSVSIQLWGIACASVISLASEAAVAMYALVSTQGAGDQKQAQAFAAGGQNLPKSTAGTRNKEL